MEDVAEGIRNHDVIFILAHGNLIRYGFDGKRLRIIGAWSDAPQDRQEQGQVLTEAFDMLNHLRVDILHDDVHLSHGGTIILSYVVAAIRPILTIGAEPLALRSDEIVDFGPASLRLLRLLANDMIATMYAAGGVGLAAPQIGVNVRLICIDTSIGKNDGDLIVMVNPVIYGQEGKAKDTEGCLSVPRHTSVVSRPECVSVSGRDLNGDAMKVGANDLLARALCHEVDHLDGRLFVDRLSPLKRQLLLRKLRKDLKRSLGT